MNRKNGVSVTVLIITAVVMSILSGLIVVNMNVITYDNNGNPVKNNTIKDSREVKFKNEIVKSKEEIETYILTKKAQDLKFDTTKVNIVGNQFDNYLRRPSDVVKKYLEVKNGVVYCKINITKPPAQEKNEIQWLKDLNILELK